MATNKQQGCVIAVSFTTTDSKAAVDIKESIAALLQGQDDYRVDFRLMEAKHGTPERRLDNA